MKPVLEKNLVAGRVYRFSYASIYKVIRLNRENGTIYLLFIGNVGSLERHKRKIFEYQYDPERLWEYYPKDQPFKFGR